MCNSVFLRDLKFANNSEKAVAPHSSTLAWKIPWTQEFLPGESQGRGNLVGYRLCGCTESDTTEAT